jgi:hypothetical protein
MLRKAKILTTKEFASLLAVGDGEISDRPAPVIPAEHDGMNGGWIGMFEADSRARRKPIDPGCDT